ncbi:MAG: beta-N-acetylhexosaminidase [Planctomycetes bacterium]|nr:beta-N-acetylhexosaminidase [Planctomycetota bacterium]
MSVDVPLIPRPRHVEARPDSFSLRRLTDMVLVDWPGTTRDATRAVASRASNDLHSALGWPVPFRDDGALRIRHAESSAEEAYSLEIGARSVTIEASTPRGVAHATSTLLQLVESAVIDGAPRLPGLRIDDAPRFPWRGMHLDVCRHFFDVGFVEHYLDLLATHRLNVFHWHLTEDQGWRLEVPRHPRLTSTSAWRDEDGERYGGFYTAEDVRRVVRYAADRGIEVIPEIELPGHAVAALAAFPELSCRGEPMPVATTWGIFDDVYCAGNDAVFAFLADVFDVVVDLFPSERVHIGGDECPKARWQECARCRARSAAEGLTSGEELQSWFVRRVSGLLHDRGKRLIGWDEILEGGLAPDATVMSWRGTAGAIEAARSGHEVILCPTSHCYFDYQQADSPIEPGAHGVIPLETVYAFEPVPEELDETEARLVLGGQGNVWTERMASPRDVEYMALPRMSALAEALWSPAADRDFDDFRTRLDPHLRRLDRRRVNYRRPK